MAEPAGGRRGRTSPLTVESGLGTLDRVEWLNYHHLLYFYLVAREGTIARAGKILRLSQPTISGQIKALEEALGEQLFSREGRTLQLTETGRIVYRYADEIFTLGRELQDVVKGRPTGQPARLHVGVADIVPKLIAHRLIEPALRTGNVRVVCSEDKTERLLAELSIRGLDLVLTDAPIGGAAKVRAYSHLLGECGVTFFARADLRDELERGFPLSLDGAPMLLPTQNTTLRASIDSWLEAVGVRPRIVGEFEDSALMKVFGRRGEGVFPGPTAIEREIRIDYGVAVVGRVEDLRERFYAISVERRVKHPAVLTIIEHAKTRLFRR